MTREARIDRLEDALGRLAEAQVRTEERVGRLMEAQARTEATLQALAQQVGRLTETIGFTLEDLAREVTPAYLAQHYGIQDLELDRRFFVVEGQELEVDFYGEGRRDGEVVAVVGEVRSRIPGAGCGGGRAAGPAAGPPASWASGYCSLRICDPSFGPGGGPPVGGSGHLLLGAVAAGWGPSPFSMPFPFSSSPLWGTPSPDAVRLQA